MQRKIITIFSSHNPIRIKLMFHFFSLSLVVFHNVQHIEFYHIHPSYNACTHALYHHFSNIQLHSFRILHVLIQIPNNLHFQSNLKTYLPSHTHSEKEGAPFPQQLSVFCISFSHYKGIPFLICMCVFWGRRYIPSSLSSLAMISSSLASALREGH